MKGGANIEVIAKYLEEIVHNENLSMDLAIQINANNKIVKSHTEQGLKEFNNQSVATQAKKGEQLVSMMPANKKAFIY